MNIGTYLYLIILFVVFSPGILFSVPSPNSNSKSKWIRVFTHGFLFSVAWLLTHRTVNNIWNKSVKEGVQTLDTTNIGGTDVANSTGSTAVIIPKTIPIKPFIPDIPIGYLHYFRFRGDAINEGSLSSYVPTASYSGSSPNPNGTIGGKTCLTISTAGDYVYFPAFDSSPTTPPPSNFSFGFWCCMQNACETHAIADKNFAHGTIWQGDVYGGFLTYVAANTHWTIQTGRFYNTLNTWIHIFYTVQNGTTFITYVNGVAVSTQTNGVGSFMSLSKYYMILGRAGDNAPRYFGGCGMREFVLYNRTLSATEVNDVYVLTA